MLPAWGHDARDFLPPNYISLRPPLDAQAFLSAESSGKTSILCEDGASGILAGLLPSISAQVSSFLPGEKHRKAFDGLSSRCQTIGSRMPRRWIDFKVGSFDACCMDQDRCPSLSCAVSALEI